MNYRITCAEIVCAMIRNAVAVALHVRPDTIQHPDEIRNLLDARGTPGMPMTEIIGTEIPGVSWLRENLPGHAAGINREITCSWLGTAEAIVRGEAERTLLSAMGTPGLRDSSEVMGLLTSARNEMDLNHLTTAVRIINDAIETANEEIRNHTDDKTYIPDSEIGDGLCALDTVIAWLGLLT